jgi:N-formylglutamate deformylase
MTTNEPLPNDALLAAFLDCSLPADQFNHRTHLRVAWLLLERYPLEEAVERICGGIQRYATHLGAAEKYHPTLSEALARLMAHGGAGTSSVSWEHFLATNAELLSDVRGTVAKYYSPERLASPEAKRHFVPPDRRPLPTCATQTIER